MGSATLQKEVCGALVWSGVAHVQQQKHTRRLLQGMRQACGELQMLGTGICQTLLVSV